MSTGTPLSIPEWFTPSPDIKIKLGLTFASATHATYFVVCATAAIVGTTEVMVAFVNATHQRVVVFTDSAISSLAVSLGPWPVLRPTTYISIGPWIPALLPTTAVDVKATYGEIEVTLPATVIRTRCNPALPRVVVSFAQACPHTRLAVGVPPPPPPPPLVVGGVLLDCWPVSRSKSATGTLVAIVFSNHTVIATCGRPVPATICTIGNPSGFWPSQPRMTAPFALGMFLSATFCGTPCENFAVTRSQRKFSGRVMPFAPSLLMASKYGLSWK